MIYIVIFWNYINILEVFEIQALIIEPHKWYLCETNSIQKTTKFIINIMSRKKSWRKNHQFFQIHQINMNNNSWWFQEYETRTKIKKEVITTSLRLSSTMSHKKIQILCKEVLLYTKPGKQNFCWVGTQKIFLNFNINRKPYFCQKLIKRHFVVNEFLSYQNLISQSMFGVTKIDKKYFTKIV